MKKISILLLALAIAGSLAACGRNNDNGANSTSDMTILPTAMPTLDTNIPDPEIDTQMPMYTEGTGMTNPSAGESAPAADSK